MNNRSKDLLGSLKSYRKLAEVLQPGIAPLDYPPSLVPPHLSSVLMRGNCVVAASWDDRLYPSLHKQRSHCDTVVASVTYQPLRLTSLTLTRLDAHVGKRCFQKLHLRRRSLLQVYSERSTRAIGQYHKLCSLAAFSLPDQRTPFLARMNMPSMKHSSQRTFCRSESWFKKARQRFRRISPSAHSLRRRWTALFEPYLSGSSLQGAPVHRIQRMPSKHLRSSSGGRPPFRERWRLGKCCLMSSHCLSVTARQAIGYLLDLVSYRASISCQPV
jgi:hypothetical protein